MHSTVSVRLSIERSLLILHIHDLAAVLDGGCNHPILRHIRWNLAFGVRHRTTYIHIHPKLSLINFRIASI